MCNNRLARAETCLRAQERGVAGRWWDVIGSLADLRRHLDEDRLASGKGRPIGWLDLRLNPHRATLRFQRRLRWAEYAINTKRGRAWAPLVWWLRWRAVRSGQRLGLTIPPNVFGPGLSIPHWGTIVVNRDAEVGANCRIQPGTCIGAGRRGERLPIIGDDVHIGPGVKILGGVRVGDGVTLGANAVVVDNLPPRCFAAGAPARVIVRGDDRYAPRRDPRDLAAASR